MMSCECHVVGHVTYSIFLHVLIMDYIMTVLHIQMVYTCTRTFACWVTCNWYHMMSHDQLLQSEGSSGMPSGNCQTDHPHCPWWAQNPQHLLTPHSHTLTLTPSHSHPHTHTLTLTEHFQQVTSVELLQKVHLIPKHTPHPNTPKPPHTHQSFTSLPLSEQQLETGIERLAFQFNQVSRVWSCDVMWYCVMSFGIIWLPKTTRYTWWKVLRELVKNRQLPGIELRTSYFSCQHSSTWAMAHLYMYMYMYMYIP